MPKHFDKAERVGLLGQNDPVFFYFRRSRRGIVLTTPLIYLNPYSGNRRLIALRTFSAVNCPVILKIAQIAQKFLTGHFTNEEPNSLVNPQRRPWTNLEKLTKHCCLQNQIVTCLRSCRFKLSTKHSTKLSTKLSTKHSTKLLECCWVSCGVGSDCFGVESERFQNV